MTSFQYITASIKYYWKSHLMVILGIAISTMVLTGTLVLGDSVSSSLEKAALLRLGKTEHLFSGIDRFFRSSLADEIRNNTEIKVAPILQLNGVASSQGGKYKLNAVQVIGIDEHFSSFIPNPQHPILPPDNEAYISENLARRLQLVTGDAFVLRVEKASQIPKNAPFISDANNYISLRLKVARILGPDELGRFNLKASQTAPYNVFLPLAYLHQKLDLHDKANSLLFAGPNEDIISNAIIEQWKLEDMALGIFPVNDGKDWEIRSNRIFMDSTILAVVRRIDPQADPIITYMVNAFRVEHRETPYSFISAGPFLGEDATRKEMIINEWMANDLQASVGDSITISYYVIGPLRNLSVEQSRFIITDIVSIEGTYAEMDLMPDIPGLSDAGNCREWEAGVPIDLEKIRDKDEAYWRKYRGTPKAFIPYEAGKSLWQNRFGNCTAIRLSSQNINPNTLDNQLTEIIPPSGLGFSLRSIREEGLTAARGGVDFTQLFMGLSFFLLMAALILMVLLFNLHIEKRKVEMGTLKALGFKRSLIRKTMLVEGLLLVIPGVLAGGLLAILYNKLIFSALNTVWYDIVRTSILQEEVHYETLLEGMAITLILVMTAIWFNIIKKLKSQTSALQSKIETTTNNKHQYLRHGSWGSILIAFGLLIKESFFGDQLNAWIFFLVGALLLIGLLLFVSNRLSTTTFDKERSFSFSELVQRNVYRNKNRSLRIIILFALGTFVVISTGLNRKDLHSGAHLPTSGTGGFTFYMETTLPFLKDLNLRPNQVDYGIDQPLNFVQLRKNEGDDASCLNLNRVTAPRILGVPSEKLTGRFSFIRRTSDLDPEQPWMSLASKLRGDVIPAVVDQTVLQWGLGKKVGDTLIYLDEFGQEMKLKVIGGLANSIFQGNVLIDENLFLEHFPSNSGTYVMLVDGLTGNTEEVANTLNRALRNEGLEITNTADRLAAFNQVENTYLSIFMLLGGLAMILGTFGLGIILIRNIIDREQEIGILQAIGYSRKIILNLVTTEHVVLLMVGTMSGAIAAFVAVIPSLLSEFIQGSWETALVLIVLILLNGFLWIFLITRKILSGDLYQALRKE